MADKSANKPKKGAHLIKKQAPKPEKPAQAVRTEAKQPKKKRRVPIGVKIAVGVVIAAAAGAFGYVYCYPNVFPGVTVGPITVGGMNRDDAANTIEDQSAPLYEGKNVTVTIYDSNYDIPVDYVLKSVDGIQSAENARRRIPHHGAGNRIRENGRQPDRCRKERTFRSRDEEEGIRLSRPPYRGKRFDLQTLRQRLPVARRDRNAVPDETALRPAVRPPHRTARFSDIHVRFRHGVPRQTTAGIPRRRPRRHPCARNVLQLLLLNHIFQGEVLGF